MAHLKNNNPLASIHLAIIVARFLDYLFGHLQ